MLQMMKRDYIINKVYFLIVILLVPFIYALDMSPQFIYVGIVVGCIFNVFYYDGHNHVSRYIVSLPVSRNHIVLGRYTFLLIVAVTFLLYLWMIDMLVHYFFPMINNWIFFATSFQPITPAVIIFTFIPIIIVVAVSVPIYYFFQSFIKSLLAQGALLFIGVLCMAIFGKYIPESIIIIIIDMINIQPVLIMFILSIICLSISFKLSATIFTKRDII